MIIARTEGRNPLRYELPIGERLPLHLGAGKALAAYLPDDQLDEWIEAVTPFTTVVGHEVSAEEYRAELEQVRARGFSEATEERVLGGRSIAAPVMGRDGRVIAAVQVASTLAAIPDEAVGVVASAVRTAAETLGRRI